MNMECQITVSKLENDSQYIIQINSIEKELSQLNYEINSAVDEHNDIIYEINDIVNKMSCFPDVDKLECFR